MGRLPSLDMAPTTTPPSERARWRMRRSAPWRPYSHRAQASTRRKDGSASFFDVGVNENGDFASRITPGSGNDVMRRPPLMIDLSKRLWHDAARMSLKETSRVQSAAPRFPCPLSVKDGACTFRVCPTSDPIIVPR